MLALATRAELAVWLFGPETRVDDPRMPADAERLLLRASELVEGRALAGYATTTQSLPRDRATASWLSDATCAQVEFWQVVSEEHGIAGVTSGSLSASGVSHNMPSLVGPRVIELLDLAGLRDPGGTVRPYRRPFDLIRARYNL